MNRSSASDIIAPLTPTAHQLGISCQHIADALAKIGSKKPSATLKKQI